MSETSFVWGPTFAEMREPERLPEPLRRRAREALRSDPLDPVNLFNIHWKDASGKVRAILLPEALTGVRAPIVVLVGKDYPSGSHKVGAVYSCLAEKQLDGRIRPGEHVPVFPSTGNYGIGGAWVGPRMGYRSLVVLPEEMSRERFDKMRALGAQVIATPGCESNVKEIYDEVKRLKAEPGYVSVNQFEELGNYRFHFGVTGEAVLEAARDLAAEGIGDGRVAAFVSAMGSAGTIAAGDRIKQVHPGALTVGLEPVQCPTLYDVGFGGHRIEGIGDKHVTWIHDVHAMDALFCIDDQACLEGLSLLEEGGGVLEEEGVPPEAVGLLQGTFGVSGVCNVLGAIKAARFYGLGPQDPLVTVATDGFDRYPSVLARLAEEAGRPTRERSLRRLDLFHRATPEPVLEATQAVRRRWHNQKYFTWVEQQGKSVEELRALADPESWAREQERIPEIDARLAEARGPLERWSAPTSV